jgi:spore germination protein KA
MVTNQKLPERGLESPSSESSLLGAEIGLTESLKTNIAIIKHYFKDSTLKIIKKTLGTTKKTDIAIFYMDDLVNKDILDDVLYKIEKMDVAYVLHPQIIIEELAAEHAGFIPTVKISERYDALSSDLLQGRIVIICDHTPLSLTVPAFFWGFFQTPDEYQQNYGRLVSRIIRIMCLFLSMFLPGIYLAAVQFHMGWIDQFEIAKEMMDEKHLLPTMWELVFIMLIFRIAIDASLHTYKAFTFFLAILTTLTIGEMAVVTHLLNGISIIVVGVTYLCGFLVLIKGFSGMTITVRWFCLLIGNYFGLIGIGITIILLILWAISIKSFGVPYLSPIIPFRPKQAFRDVLWRGNLKKIINTKHHYKE